MSKIENTVFISYRRDNISWALAVYQYLTSHDYDVFFDYTSIPSGDFEQVIVSSIKARAHFVIVLTPDALDRCVKPDDWLRREIETAMDEKRNIVPLCFDGFRFGPSISEKLMGKLENLGKYNGLNIHADYFQEGMARLQKQFLNRPLDAVLHPEPPEVIQVVKEEQAAADKDVRLLLEPELLTNPETKDAAPLVTSATSVLPEEASSAVVHQELEAMRDADTKSAESPLSGELAFYPTVALTLREQPFISPDTLIRYLPVSERLVSLEEPTVAMQKVGVQGEWLKVRDTSGREGYVAAWYVKLAEGSATPLPESEGLNPGQLALVPIAELSLRSQPVIAPQTAILRIPVTEQLICLEPADEAIPKIGVEGQWLHVQDERGNEGYIAAWYVRYASGSTASQATILSDVMPGSTGPLKVRVTAEGTALRKQPVIRADTLIKRLPLGTELTVTEPDAAHKIGKHDQWLSVKDRFGTKGFVAAWFVTSSTNTFVSGTERAKEKMRENIIETYQDFLVETEQRLDDTARAVLGSLVEEASAEIVQRELEAMGQAVQAAGGSIQEEILPLRSRIQQTIQEFAGGEIGADTTMQELNLILERLPRTGDTKG